MTQYCCSQIIRYMAKYKTDNAKHVINILKALADMSRLRIIMVLVGRELCVCQIIELLGLAPSTVSKHLYILKQAGLIESDKKGRWVHYGLAPDASNKTVQKAVGWLKEFLAADERIIEDKKRLKKILKEDPERLCLKIKER